ncbi:uncharacterized protein LOC127428783 [Myxocyprinus asiaticus]|uniref:uncharacterized protein LOC127428783 n=1 Tax=Myxocyprinus asiaticus TaxID=70543 RepID=UPI0022217155|nr:uncharacterized protein LOC127428783 [Myxocyprinus asiaticus]
MPPVEQSTASRTALGPACVSGNPRCPGKECAKSDRMISCSFNAAAHAARMGNTLAILLAALRKTMGAEDQDSKTLIDSALAAHSQLTRDVGERLQHTGRGDDTIREALYHFRDLLGYTHLFRFVMNTIYTPNVHNEGREMCSCKEFIAQELLKMFLSIEITYQDAAEPRTALRQLQHNFRFLFQNPILKLAVEGSVVKTSMGRHFILQCGTIDSN